MLKTGNGNQLHEVEIAEILKKLVIRNILRVLNLSDFLADKCGEISHMRRNECAKVKFCQLDFSNPKFEKEA